MTAAHPLLPPPDAPAAPPGWVADTVPDGSATLQRPARWLLQTEPGGRLAVREPQGRAAALVHTHAVPAETGLADWLGRDYPAAEPGLHQVQLIQAPHGHAHLARAAFDYGSFAFRSRAIVVAVRRGGLATVYVAAARLDQLDCWLPALARVLASVRPGHGPGPPIVHPDLPLWLQARTSRRRPAHPRSPR